MAVQEAIWMKLQNEELERKDVEAITIFEDNQSAICLAKDPRNHPKTKHIAVKYHFLREIIKEKKINVQYCPTEKMLADIFPKAIHAEKFREIRYLLGMRAEKELNIV